MKDLLIPHKPSRRLLLPKVTGKPEPDELKRHGYGVLLSTPQGLEMGTGPETWEKTGSGGGGGNHPGVLRELKKRTALNASQGLVFMFDS